MVLYLHKVLNGHEIREIYIKYSIIVNMYHSDCQKCVSFFVRLCFSIYFKRFLKDTLLFSKHRGNTRSLHIAYVMQGVSHRSTGRSEHIKSDVIRSIHRNILRLVISLLLHYFIMEIEPDAINKSFSESDLEYVAIDCLVHVDRSFMSFFSLLMRI